MQKSVVGGVVNVEAHATNTMSGHISMAEKTVEPDLFGALEKLKLVKRKKKT